MGQRQSYELSDAQHAGEGGGAAVVLGEVASSIVDERGSAMATRIAPRPVANPTATASTIAVVDASQSQHLEVPAAAYIDVVTVDDGASRPLFRQSDLPYIVLAVRPRPSIEYAQPDCKLFSVPKRFRVSLIAEMVDNYFLKRSPFCAF